MFFQPPNSSIGKVLLARIFALLCLAHTLQSVLERGQEARIPQIDFSAFFDWVIHQWILFKLCCVGVGGPVLYVLTQFLLNRSQYVVVDGYRRKLFNVVQTQVACNPQRTSFWVMLKTSLS